MILGAGIFQVPLIEKAKQLGFYTIVVSVGGDYPGFKIADKAYSIDIRDKEKILDAAKAEDITGILTDQTDIAVSSVSYVAEKLGLKGISYSCAVKFTNKYEMRKCCDEIGVKVPKYFKASNLDEVSEHAKKLKLPFIIKPIDNQGSRGVSKVNNLNELKFKFEDSISNSSSRLALLEEFIKGKEIIIAGFISGFNHINLAIGDRDYFDLNDIFIPRQTFFPSDIKESIKKKVLSINSHLVNCFNPEFGITHNEYIIEEGTDEIFLVEAAIRGGGVFISSDLVPLAAGVHVDLYLLELASGLKKSINICENNLLNNSAGYLCFYLPEGIIKKISGKNELIEIKGVHKIYLNNLKAGDRTKPIKDKSMRCGPILIKGKNRDECSEIIKQIKNTLKIEVETADGIKGINW